MNLKLVIIVVEPKILESVITLVDSNSDLRVLFLWILKVWSNIPNVGPVITFVYFKRNFWVIFVVSKIKKCGNRSVAWIVNWSKLATTLRNLQSLSSHFCGL